MQNEKLIKLQKDTGCDAILGKLLLKFTGDDVEGAIKIIKSVDKDIFVVRGKFIAQGLKYYGAFVFFYESKNKVIDKINIAIKKDDKTAIEFDFNNSWYVFNQDLINFVKSNQIDVALHDKFNYQIKNHKAINLYEMAIVRSKEYDEKSLRLFFDDIFFNITGDPDIAVKIKIDKTNVFEMNKGNIQEYQVDPQEEKSENKQKVVVDEEKPNQDVLVLKVDPELSPVDGIEISEIMPGEFISVKIVDERPIAEYITSLLNAKDLVINENRMISAKVKDIIISDEGYIVKVEFGPGIIGVGYFGENVKLKVEKKEFFEEINDKEFPSNVLVKNFWLVGCILVAAIFILLLLIVRP